MDDYNENSNINTKFEWYGRVALIADILSKYSKLIGSEIRKRRLKYYNNPVDSDSAIIKCLDIAVAINTEMVSRGLTDNEHYATI